MGFGPEILGFAGDAVGQGFNLFRDLATMGMRAGATAAYGAGADSNIAQLRQGHLEATTGFNSAIDQAREARNAGWQSMYGSPGQRSSHWAFGDPTKTSSPDLAGAQDGSTMGGLTGIAQKTYRDLMVGDMGLIPMARQTMSEIAGRGGDIVKGLADDVGSRLNQFSTSMSESLTSANSDVDAAVAAGALTPAAAEAQKQTNRMGIASQVYNAGTSLMADFQRMKVGVQTTTMQTLAQASTNLTGMIAQGRMAAGENLGRAFGEDRQFEADLLAWDQNIIEADKQDRATQASSNWGLLTSMIGMVEGMQRTTASMFAGIPLTAAESSFDPAAPVQGLAQNWMNRRAQRQMEKQNESDGWF